jgi:hypothetical protein
VFIVVKYLEEMLPEVTAAAISGATTEPVAAVPTGAAAPAEAAAKSAEEEALIPLPG